MVMRGAEERRERIGLIGVEVDHLVVKEWGYILENDGQNMYDRRVGRPK